MKVLNLLTAGVSIDWLHIEGLITIINTVTGYTLLHAAVMQQNQCMITSLIQTGVDPNIQGREGFTPLHIAAMQGYLFEAQLLIQAGANLNRQDIQGWTPLRWAILNRNVDMVKLLCTKGARLDIEDKESLTILGNAIFCLNTSNQHNYQNSLEIILFLIILGIHTKQDKRDLLRSILNDNYYHQAKTDRDILYKGLGEILNKEKEVSYYRVRCALHIYSKIHFWKECLIAFHKTFQKAASAKPIHHGHVLRLSPRVVQNFLIRYLEENVRAYNPQTQLGSDIPKVLQNLPGAITSLLKDVKNEKTSEDQFNQTFFMHTSRDTDKFIDEWHNLLAKYLEKTLPPGLTEYFHAQDVRTISEIIDWYATLLKGWSRTPPLPIFTFEGQDTYSTVPAMRLF